MAADQYGDEDRNGMPHVSPVLRDMGAGQQKFIRHCFAPAI